MSLGNNLTRLRKSRNWTLQQVSEKLQLRGFSTYSNWEYDRTQPDAETLVRIASLYDITVDDLLDRKERANEDRVQIMVDKQRLLDYLKVEIKNRNEYIDIIKATRVELVSAKFDSLESLAFHTGAESALIRLLSVIEEGKFDEEAKHDA